MRPITVDPKYLINQQGKDFVLYTGLLDAAHRNGLVSLKTRPVLLPTAELALAVFECTVVMEEYTGAVLQSDGSPTSTVRRIEYVGHGDATPENVGGKVAKHYIRMAETRSKARALRDALNIAEAAFEEIDAAYEPDPRSASKPAAKPAPKNSLPADPNGPPSSEQVAFFNQAVTLLTGLGVRNVIAEIPDATAQQAEDILNFYRDQYARLKGQQNTTGLRETDLVLTYPKGIIDS